MTGQTRSSKYQTEEHRCGEKSPYWSSCSKSDRCFHPRNHSGGVCACLCVREPAGGGGGRPAVLSLCLEEARVLACKSGADRPAGLEAHTGRSGPSVLPETGPESRCRHAWGTPCRYTPTQPRTGPRSQLAALHVWTLSAPPGKEVTGLNGTQGRARRALPPGGVVAAHLPRAVAEREPHFRTSCLRPCCAPGTLSTKSRAEGHGFRLAWSDPIGPPRGGQAGWGQGPRRPAPGQAQPRHWASATCEVGSLGDGAPPHVNF